MRLELRVGDDSLTFGTTPSDMSGEYLLETGWPLAVDMSGVNRGGVGVQEVKLASPYWGEEVKKVQLNGKGIGVVTLKGNQRLRVQLEKRLKPSSGYRKLSWRKHPALLERTHVG